MTISVHGVVKPWDEGTATWRSMADAYEDEYASVDVFGGFYHIVDITGLAQSWIDETLPNGMMIRGNETPDYTHYKNFYAGWYVEGLNPELYIEWIAPTATPTATPTPATGWIRGIVWDDRDHVAYAKWGNPASEEWRSP